MPLVYKSSLATAGNLTTNATPNTETDAWFLKAGVRNAMLQRVDVGGKAAGLTALSGIVFRIIKFGTASTSGTGITPSPADPGMQACKATAASRPTAGSTRTNRNVFTCGASGANSWVAENVDSVELLEGSAAGSIDMMDACGTASLTYETSFTHAE